MVMQAEDRSALVKGILQQGCEGIVSSAQGTADAHQATTYSYTIRNGSRLQEMLGKLSTPANVLRNMEQSDPASAQAVQDLRNVVKVCTVESD
jgi:hypothetical protein